MVKTPEEIKKGLECKTRLHPGSTTACDCQCYECDVYVPGYTNDDLWCDALAYIQQLEDAIDKTTQLMQSATEVIKKNQEQLESTYSQVKKALCGKENVSWVEVLEAADQLKSRLAQAERENQALIHDMKHVAPVEICEACAHSKLESKCEENNFNCDKCPEDCPCKTCLDCRESFQWRGICADNTKEETNEN